MTADHALAIREARRAVNLTQEQLSQRVGVKPHSVLRWERPGGPRPSRRNLLALVAAIQAIDQAIAKKLTRALESVSQSNDAPPSNRPEVAFELAVFAMAEELDLPSRSMRSALSQFIEQMRANEFDLEFIQRQLERFANTR